MRMEEHLRRSYFKDKRVEQVANLAQQNFECCGVNGTEDYLYSYFYNETGNIVPQSCCQKYNLTGWNETDFQVWEKNKNQYCFDIFLCIFFSFI